MKAQDHEAGGAEFEKPHGDGAEAGATAREAPEDVLGSEREHGDDSHGQRGPEPHDEGGCDARPEQTLRQGEDENQDRARARPQAHRQDPGETVAPPAGTADGEVRPMRVAAMGVVLAMGVMGMVGAGFARAIVMRAIVARLTVMRVIVIGVVVMRVVTVMRVRRARGRANPPRGIEDNASLGPDQPVGDWCFWPILVTG